MRTDQAEGSSCSSARSSAIVLAAFAAVDYVIQQLATTDIWLTWVKEKHVAAQAGLLFIHMMQTIKRMCTQEDRICFCHNPVHHAQQYNKKVRACSSSGAWIAIVALQASVSVNVTHAEVALHRGCVRDNGLVRSHAIIRLVSSLSPHAASGKAYS